MAAFKVGDKLRQIHSGNAPELVGQVITITEARKGWYDSVGCSWSEEYLMENFKLVSSKTNMNLIQKLALLMKGEPEKSFFKAGITNPDYTLTEEGKEVFMQWLLKKNGDAFKTEVVDPILAEQKENE